MQEKLAGGMRYACMHSDTSTCCAQQTQPAWHFLALHKPTCVTNAAEVPADALVLRRGHLDGGCVVCVRDAQVFTVNVHQLDLKVTDAVLV
jgi:hypothetical protein